MAFDVPRDVVFPVSSVSVRLSGEPHPFEFAHSAEIAASWQREIAANPALFDGRVALLAELSYHEGALLGLCHIVRYSTFLYWRRLRPMAVAEHAYAHAMPVTSDGALVAIRMGPHTVGAGQVYFAAGSFEPADFRDGAVDLDFNMRREVLEETGLDLGNCAHEDAFHALSKSTGTAIFRRYRLDMTAGEAVARIEAHVAAEAEPEIEGPIVIRGAHDLPDGLAPQMPGLIDWHFANPIDL
ncbi:hypothetical protein [Aquamicrobium sp. LC103]|uniref:hypothetical protein n=1 Tax=Aquamicrobium sp. LC103 TaxID=1120658 RepID=UPI00063ECB37|nr:hypothetical protein [Aquamicrobium sp. LC103]TKT80080.1 hypothetical protein XW59_006925 [Aquamicrobium sp. LC103]